MISHHRGCYRFTWLSRMEVYDEILRRAGELLAARISVLLDGTSPTTKLRAQAASLARRHGADVLLVHCQCPDEVASERIASRLAAGSPLSESRPEFIYRQRQHEESDPPGLATCTVDTTVSLPAMRNTVFNNLRMLLASWNEGPAPS